MWHSLSFAPTSPHITAQRYPLYVKRETLLYLLPDFYKFWTWAVSLFTVQAFFYVPKILCLSASSEPKRILTSERHSYTYAVIKMDEQTCFRIICVLSFNGNIFRIIRLNSDRRNNRANGNRCRHGLLNIYCRWLYYRNQTNNPKVLFMCLNIIN